NVQETSFDSEAQAGFAGLSAGEPGEPAQTPAQKTIVKSADDWSKTSRNATCPCGSGKKYKMCHGRTI
ncbi:MAG: SEC-C metal-binding domain-containing protein, partial [Ilumatobacteraceae bacterium]